MKYSREIDWANQHQKQNKKALQSLLKGNRKKLDDLGKKLGETQDLDILFFKLN